MGITPGTWVEVISLKAWGAGEFLKASQAPISPCAEGTICIIFPISTVLCFVPILQTTTLRLTEVTSLTI